MRHTLDLGPNTLPGAQQYTTVESAAALSIQEKFKGKYDDNICNANGQYRNERYKRAENMVPQLDGTYNVSDDSDLDSHSYLDLASSNIIAHRMQGQKQRYETDIRAHTSKHLACKESTKPNVNINTKGQKVPDDENIDINKIAQGDRPKGGRNTADITAKQHKDKEAKRLVPEKVKRIQGQNDSKNIEAKRHIIEKAKIEALIEKHRLCTPKTPDEVNKLGTGKNAIEKGQEGTSKGKPPYKKATKDIQIKKSHKKETELIALTENNYIPLTQAQISLCAKIGYMYYCEYAHLLKKRMEHTCMSAIYYDQGSDIKAKQCKTIVTFDTIPESKILDAGNLLILSNLQKPWTITCKDISRVFEIEYSTYRILNRSELCECSLTTGNYLLSYTNINCGNVPEARDGYFTTYYSFNKIVLDVITEKFDIQVDQNTRNQAALLHDDIPGYDLPTIDFVNMTTDQDEDVSILEEDNSQIYAYLDNVLVHMIDKQQTAIFMSNQDFNKNKEKISQYIKYAEIWQVASVICSYKAMACDVLLIVAMIIFLLKYRKTMQAMLTAFLQINTKNSTIQPVQADRIGRTYPPLFTINLPKEEENHRRFKRNHYDGICCTGYYDYCMYSYCNYHYVFLLHKMQTHSYYIQILFSIFTDFSYSTHVKTY